MILQNVEYESGRQGHPVKITVSRIQKERLYRAPQEKERQDDMTFTAQLSIKRMAEGNRVICTLRHTNIQEIMKYVGMNVIGKCRI